MAKDKSKTESKASEERPKTAEDLSDDDQRALLFQHRVKYEKGLATKKKADADFKNICKLAKAEFGVNAVEEIKLAIQLDSEEGQAALREKRAREARVARWMAADLGTQFDLDLSAMSSTDRAFAEGEQAAARGEPAKPPAKYMPGSPDYEFWLNGHYKQSGATTIGRGKAGATIGDAPATHEIAH